MHPHPYVLDFDPPVDLFRIEGLASEAAIKVGEKLKVRRWK